MIDGEGVHFVEGPEGIRAAYQKASTATMN